MTQDHNHNHHHDHVHQETDIPVDRQGVCIVTGDAVDKQEAEALGHVCDYDGQKLYFCCATCVQLFDKDPEQYAHHHLGHEHHHHIPTSDTLHLKEEEHLTDNVWAFRFTADQPLLWTPGQFIRVEIPHDHPDEEGTKRWFTISSTPHDGYIQITTRITETSFKQALAALQPGDSIKLIEKPDGDFVWQEDEKPLILIAGGIGITPFYSMLKARGHSHKPFNAILIYNGRDDNLPFKAEFAEASKRHPELKVHYVVGKQLSVEDMALIVPNLTSSQVYISGPEPMVEALGSRLEEAGVPKSQLHQDFFPNYTDTNY